MVYYNVLHTKENLLWRYELQLLPKKLKTNIAAKDSTNYNYKIQVAATKLLQMFYIIKQKNEHYVTYIE